MDKIIYTESAINQEVTGAWPLFPGIKQDNLGNSAIGLTILCRDGSAIDYDIDQWRLDVLSIRAVGAVSNEPFLGSALLGTLRDGNVEYDIGDLPSPLERRCAEAAQVDDVSMEDLGELTPASVPTEGIDQPRPVLGPR